jgi:hypothetical protein
MQRTVRRLDEDVSAIVDSLARIESTQKAHTTTLTELRSDVTELRSGMSEVLTLLRGDHKQE